MESKSKIANPERIYRLVGRMCDAQMNLVMKTSKDSPTGIRASFRGTRDIKGRKVVYIGGISEKGLKKLRQSKQVKAEVLGMPSRVMFVAQVLQCSDTGAILSLPKQLVSIERRQNMRYPTTNDYMAYVALSGWLPEKDDLAAPPLLNFGARVENWITLADLSLGGACVYSRFKSALSYVESGPERQQATLIFPMMEPIQLNVIIRWQKKTVNRMVDQGVERARLEYRFGIEFEHPTEEAILKIRQFMRKLSMAQAI